MANTVTLTETESEGNLSYEYWLQLTAEISFSCPSGHCGGSMVFRVSFFALPQGVSGDLAINIVSTPEILGCRFEESFYLGKRNLI